VAQPKSRSLDFARDDTGQVDCNKSVEVWRDMIKYAGIVILGAMAGGLLVTVSMMGGAPKPESSKAVFERRIAPILKSPNPSTCSECHLSGVDLKDYIRATDRETFAALRDAGMIDVKQPEQSHLLKLIRMSSPRTPLVTQKARDAEYEAFHEWIVAAASDPAMRQPANAGVKRPVGPAVSAAVIRHTRMDNVTASFVRNVWSQQGRCMGCHTPGTKENDEHVRKYGERVRWFVPDSPEGTMQKLLAQKLINVDRPEESLLLLKPLNKVPHGGGVKFIYGDAGYKQFRAWIEDYAASVKGTYKAERELPKPPDESLVYTDCILTVTNCPESWGDKLLRVDAYAWDRARNAWSEKPVATGDRQVWGKMRTTNLWMWLTPPAGGEAEKAARRNPRLAPGRYLLKYYCDTAGKLNGDYRLPTDAPAFYQGQQEITSEWRTGWGAKTEVAVSLTK
jgi:hypothetical protein